MNFLSPPPLRVRYTGGTSFYAKVFFYRCDLDPATYTSPGFSDIKYDLRDEVSIGDFREKQGLDNKLMARYCLRHGRNP